MADSSEPHPRPSQHPSTASSLQYPTLPPLSASVEEWLSRSRPISMTSTPMEHHSKSLSESWATMSASDVHSEDGTRSEQTDLGSLIDQTGPDDVASLDGRSSNSDIDTNDEDGFDGDGYESRSNVSVSQELSSAFPHIRNSIDDSNLTTKTALRQSVESIEFIEPENWPEIERVELKHTIRVFEGSDTAELEQELPHRSEGSTVTATVQQTMTRKSLDTDKPFHVVYIGSPEFRNIILDKIGDVLVSSTYSGFESSSTESSRYHVVPTSFGAGAVPNFAELLPIHVQLIVDECTEATADPHMDKPSTITLKFKGRPPCSSMWSGADYCISSSVQWALPDVAIFFLSGTDTPEDIESQKMARILMERHGVPTMVISEKPLWTMSRDPVPLNPHSLHMCLEFRNALDGKSKVLRRYPIDLKTFESITPGQLNRNLASLATICPRKPCQMALENLDSPRTNSFWEWCTSIHKDFSRPYIGDYGVSMSAYRFIAFSILSIVFVFLGHTAMLAANSTFSRQYADHTLTKAVTPVSSSVPATSFLHTVTSLSVLPSSLGDPELRGDHVSSNTLLHDLIEGVQYVSERHELTDSFEIQVVGDCHLVIKPPHQLGKKQPKFHVQVSRNGKPLEYELSMLFDGVYTLKLDRADAYGQVDVTLTTITTKPHIQTTSVDFGTPWLKIQNWKRAAHLIASQILRDFATAQTGLSEVYGRVCTDLQVLMGDVVRRAHFLRKEASTLRPESVQISRETKDIVVSRSEQFTEVVKKGAVQPLLAVSSALQAQTHKVHTGAREMMSGTWDKISSHAHALDLGAVKERLRDARKCKALDTAQKRARSLVRRRSCQQSECSQ